MKKSETALLTVYFDLLLPFWKVHLESVAAFEGEFDWILIWDSKKTPIRPDFSGNCQILTLPGPLSPAQIREYGIRFALKDGYRNLIFSDGDDLYSANRIKESRNALENNDFVFNEISLMNESGQIFENQILKNGLGCPQKLNDFKAILDFNFHGLSHTGLRLSTLKNLPETPKNNVAFDWWLYTLMLLSRANGVFLSEAVTYYRQYESNTAGMRKAWSVKRLQRHAEVRKLHYLWFRDYCRKSHPHLSQLFEARYLSAVDLEHRLSDPVQAVGLLGLAKQKRQADLGWWNIPFQLEGIYA